MHIERPNLMEKWITQGHWHVGGSLDLCKKPAWRFAPFVIFLTGTRSSCSSVARVAVLGEESVHTWGNTSISGLTFRASSPETWDPTLPPIGQWKPLRKRKSLPHIWLQTWYHWSSLHRCWQTLRKGVICGPSISAPPHPHPQLTMLQTVQWCSPTWPPFQDHNR